MGASWPWSLQFGPHFRASGVLLLLFCLLGLYLNSPCAYGSLLGLYRHRAGAKDHSPSVVNELQYFLSRPAACVPPMGFLSSQLLVTRRCPDTRLSKFDKPGLNGGLPRYKRGGPSIPQAASETSTPDVSPQTESGVNQKLPHEVRAEEPGDVSKMMETFFSSGEKQQKTVPSRGAVSDWHAQREKQQMRRAEYLQSGQRFGSKSPGPAANPTDRRILNEKQAAAEEKLDKMLTDANVQVVVHELPDCRLSLEANVSGEFTRQVWELFITSLRASLRQSVHASPLGLSQAVVLQRAGGSSAVRKDVLRFMMEAIVRKARVQQNARILGNVEFVEELDVLADRFSPGSPLVLRLDAESYPRVRFKRPYRGLKLRVPKRPYIKGQVARLTEDFLLYKHAEVVDYPNPQPVAQEGDTALLRVDKGWFEEHDGSTGTEIPEEYIRGPTTVDLVRPWIPPELLECVRGIAVGESRIIKLALPFKARQLLNIWEQKSEKQKASEARGALAPPTRSAVDKHANRPGEGSLFPLYLRRAASETKETIFTSLLGESTEAGEDAGRGGATGTNDELQCDAADSSKEAEVLESAAEKIEERSDLEEVHNVDCLLQVECVGVKQRIPPKAEDEFFMKTCGMTRAQLWEEVEASGEQLVEEAASKHALGAAAAALDDIAEVELPASLVEAQASATWKQQLKALKIQGENNKAVQTPEAFLKWKEENWQGVKSILKTAHAIQAVFRAEGLRVDPAEVQKELAKALMQAPVESAKIITERLVKKAQSRLVYEFIVKHANLEYYLDDTPAQVTVETDGNRKTQQGVKAFPKGVNIQQWNDRRKQAQKARDFFQEKAKLFSVDAKDLRQDKKEL